MDNIRLAAERELPQVQGFYWKLINDMQSSPYLPGWKVKVYPADDFLLKSLKADEIKI